jgi:hypothetical protein
MTCGPGLLYAPRMPRARVYVAAAAVVVAGCGGHASKQATPPDSCSLLTPDDIRQATGMTVGNGTKTALGWCLWAFGTGQRGIDGKAGIDGITSVAVTDRCENFKSNDKDHIQTIDGLGDAAYMWNPQTVPTSHYVCAVKGDKAFWVSYTLYNKDVSQETIALARAALSRLGNR